MGGWPGAFVAQRRLRHKCVKPRYQVTFWLIVALHQYVAFGFLQRWELPLAILRAPRSLVRLANPHSDGRRATAGEEAALSGSLEAT